MMGRIILKILALIVSGIVSIIIIFIAISPLSLPINFFRNAPEGEGIWGLVLLLLTVPTYLILRFCARWAGYWIRRWRNSR